MTQDELKSILKYDPETGIFTWIVACAARIKVGDVAGCKNKDGYVKISIGGKLHYAHRLAFLYMTGEYPPNDVDHINLDKHQNQWSNLRAATRSENLCNKPINKRNTSGFKGVSFDKARGKFSAIVTVKKKSKLLGRYETPEEASAIYQNFARELHGEYFNEAK